MTNTLPAPDRPAVRRIGIVGTGAMGGPLARRLRAQGFDVAAFARRPEACAALNSDGIATVESLGALGTDRDAVIIYVYTDDQVRQLALDDGLIEAMDRGSTLIIKTTGSPATASDLAAHGAAHGVAVVDAPASGSPQQITDGTLSVFCGGERTDVERIQPVFQAYAAQVSHIGPVGAGQMIKLINNLLFGAHVELAVEACRLAATAGIDPLDFARTLKHCSGQSYALDIVALMGSVERLVDGAGPYIAKDVAMARRVAEQIGMPIGSFDAILTPLQHRLAER
ncbi:MAG TPA: NAD(P)-dependent oxidoreductase [Ilumatobacteraceae bacterium]|nr:NAD(P)-dependent oxidoreductase [Ilumatobacteraceae bacterium]